MKLYVEKRWIASSNAEWGYYCKTPGHRIGWKRCGQMAEALSQAADFIDGDVGATIVILPDKTGEQARKAHEAYFGS